MPKRSSKSQDENQTAHAAVQRVIEQTESQKNPAAVALGRLGGLKGGKVRAARLSKKRRSQIARAAAKARWGKTP
jgi:hypothetical protein